MESRFLVNRDEFHNVQMDIRQVQVIQSSHAERLSRLERRHQEDTALKSVWSNSPFPSVLTGTPQHGPVQMPPHDMFDLGEPSQALGLEVDDEPARRGAASRANSVRFDESANWGQSTRHSGDFGPIRPGSGLAMERTLSHKSDGRHSSAGHSVHSAHSMASGRGSSLALETNLMFGGHEDGSHGSPLEITDPPPGLFHLGSVPAIIRCWITTDFVNKTLLYAAICSGAQKSTLDYSLVKELGMQDDVYRDNDGLQRVKRPVYLAEAIVSHSNSRSPNPIPQIPSMEVGFEIVNVDQPEMGLGKPSIRIFIGSDALRLHNADLLFSRNQMSLYGSDHEKLSVPFVRPEDDQLYKNLVTTNFVPEKPKLNATAAEFISGEPIAADDSVKEAEEENTADAPPDVDTDSHGGTSPAAGEPAHGSKWLINTSNLSESGGESERQPRHSTSSDQSGKDNGSNADTSRRDASAIWGSWRQGTSAAGTEGSQSVNGSMSGYQPAGRPRGMKVLRAKSGTSSSGRTGVAYEPAPAPRTSGEHRRKSQGAISNSGGENGAATASASNSIRWESKRSLNSGNNAVGGSSAGKESKPQSLAAHDMRSGAPMPRSANPVGTASAFAWMNPGKPKAPTTAVE